MVCGNPKLPVGTCSVGRRKQPRLLVAVIILNLTAAAWMSASSAFAAVVAYAAPRNQPLGVDLKSQFAGDTITSPTARPRSAMAAMSWMPSMPQTCDDDFDCNGGKANFPLQCLDLLLLKICVDPDDFEGGGGGQLAYVPIPVKAEDSPYGRQGR